MRCSACKTRRADWYVEITDITMVHCSRCAAAIAEQAPALEEKYKKIRRKVDKT